MKKILIIIQILFLTVSMAFAQSGRVKVTMLNGMSATGTVESRSNGVLQFRTDEGKTLSINMADVETIAQAKEEFDPKMMIGRWKFHYGDGETFPLLDIRIYEDHGRYYAEENYFTDKSVEPNGVIPDTDTPGQHTLKEGRSIEYTSDGNIKFYLLCIMRVMNGGEQEMIFRREYTVKAKWVNGSIVGDADIIRVFHGVGYQKGAEFNCANVWTDRKSGKIEIYYDKY